MKIITFTALALLCFATASHAADDHKGHAHGAKNAKTSAKFILP